MFNFLRAIGHHTQALGLEDAWTETGLFSPNSSQNILEGKAYYRAVRGHTIALEALWRTRWKMFCEWLGELDDGSKMEEVEDRAKMVQEYFCSTEDTRATINK